MTNSEWLRTLSDETLARLISDDWCEILNCGENRGCDRDCESRALEWLKEEVDYLTVTRDLRRYLYGAPLVLEAAEATEELTAALKASFATNSGPIMKAEPGWISTKERMPDAHVRVLLCNDEGKMVTGEMAEDDWWYCYCAYDVDRWDVKEQGRVVAWMPLPEPPKEVESDEL